MWWAFNSIKESPWAAASFPEARDSTGPPHRSPVDPSYSPLSRVANIMYSWSRSFDSFSRSSFPL
jgi:hypothetical protein